MTAPYYMFAPFDRHYDGGFGATAEAFEHAADSLEKAGESKHTNGHLPVQFLYRHAVELYLKAIIVILSKRSAAIIGEDWAPPEIRTELGNRGMTRVHNIGDLYRQFLTLLRERWPLLKDHCKTDWSSIPEKLAVAIKIIEAHDPAGTLLRYPANAQTAVEQSKSSFQGLPLDTAAERLKDACPGVGLFLVDENENVAEAFVSQDEPLKELAAALKAASRNLSGAHFGMRMEFGGGW